MLVFSKKDCIGCKICEVICSIEHTGKINPKQARIRYGDNWPYIGKVDFCRQCAKKACITACPTGALTLANSKMVTIDYTRCTSCFKCSEVCPFGQLPDDGKYPLFCDQCQGKYQCSTWCPTKALRKAGEN